MTAVYLKQGCEEAWGRMLLASARFPWFVYEETIVLNAVYIFSFEV